MQAIRGSSRFFRGAIVAVAVGLFGSVPIQGGMVDIGGGWQASWDVTLDPYVDIIPVEVSGDGTTVTIRKEAEFIQPSVNGVFPSIPMVFRQTAYPAATTIIIDDETILNSTGQDWGGFVITLIDSGDAVFDVASTDASGFTFSPFTMRTFSDGDTKLTFTGGTVLDQATWTPGGGINAGQMWIDVVPNPTYPAKATQFVLKETPLPEPASILIVVLVPLAVVVRRAARGETV